MAKSNWQRMVDETRHRKLKMEQHEPHLESDMHSCAAEGWKKKE